MPQSESEPSPHPSLWRHPDFRNLWLARTVSMSGSQISLVALPLVAVITLDATPGEMGILRAVQALPALVLSLFVGVLADRFRRRPMMIWTDIGRAVLLGAIPIAAAFDILRLELLYLIGFSVGTLSLVFDVASFSYLPSIVSRRQLVEGNSKIEVSRSISQIAGPSAGGVIVQLLTAPFAIVLDALSFVFSALFLRLIRAPESPPTQPQQRQGVMNEIREGLRFVVGEPRLRPLAASGALLNLSFGVLSTVYILYLSRDLDLSPAVIGIVLASSGPGFLIRALLAGRTTDQFGLGTALLAAQSIIGGTMLVIAFAQGPLVVVLPVLVIANLFSGIAAQVSVINSLSLRQALTPDHLLGRTNATMRFITFGAAPLAAVLGGIVGEAFGLRPALLLAATFGAVSVLWLALSPIRAIDHVSEA